MSRLQPAQILELVKTKLTDEIVAANIMPTASVFMAANFPNSTLGEPLLTQIELYLACHFVALVEERGGLTWDEYGEAQSRYADVYTSGLGSTRFGQVAITLDSSNTLSNLNAVQANNKLTAQFRVVGAGSKPCQ